MPGVILMNKDIKGWILSLIVGLFALSICCAFTWYDQRKDEKNYCLINN